MILLEEPEWHYTRQNSEYLQQQQSFSDEACDGEAGLPQINNHRQQALLASDAANTNTGQRWRYEHNISQALVRK